MAANDLYILPTDVQLIPVTELDEHAKGKFEYDPKDFVITYRHSRNSSRVIDEGAACLLKEFREAKSLVQGVLNYSVTRQLDPQEILNESYYFLVQLRKEGFLIPFSEEHTGNYQEILEPGHAFKEYEIVEKIHGVSDTRIFRIRDKEGQPYALKILLTDGKGSQLADQFYNEIRVLQHLDGEGCPALIEQGEYNGNAYMILEWVEGLPSLREAEKYRFFNDPKNVRSLLELTGNILEAYARLHARGVVHADIHPGNILITAGNKVKIIDFGLARIEGTPAKNFRGGIGFFYEPEYALAILSGSRPPHAGCEGEQYSLGALLYLLITGKQYLDFSFEKEELFRQIAYQQPLPFSKFDLDLDPEIEKTLMKSLSKEPGNRYASVTAFAEKWARLKDLATVSPILAVKDPRQAFSIFTEDLIRKFGWKGNFIDAGLQQPPTCSINLGAAGIAWFFYRLSCLREDSSLLALADVWANKAHAFVKDEEPAFYAKELDLSPKTVGRSSLYHTAAGVHFVQSLISYTMGDYNTLGRSLPAFLEQTALPCDNQDLTLGRSSLLLGCALLWEHMTLLYPPQLKEELRKSGDQLVGSIWEVLDTYPSLHEGGSVYYGMAHGWAGFLYATARWCQATGKSLPAGFNIRVDELLGLALTDGKSLRWPLNPSDQASWPGWCHGSAGYTFLWSLLHTITGEDKFIFTAEKAAHHFLSEHAPGVGNLCCGTAGQAYALLNLYRTTSDSYWLKKARQLTETTLQHSNAPTLKANSLYKGDVGLGLLFAEIEQPGYARMPVFE